MASYERVQVGRGPVRTPQCVAVRAGHLCVLGAVALAGIGVCGCPQEGGKGAWFGAGKPEAAARKTPLPPGDSPFDRSAGGESGLEASAARIELRFDVLRVQVPRGTFSQSEKIWNHIDEDVLPFELSRQLRRNGLRVGLGTEGSWPAIKAILETTPGTITLTNTVVSPDLSPLGVQLKDCPYEQTIFVYRRDYSLTGATYPPGRMLIRNDPALEPDDLSQITLRVVPELRSDSTELRWQVSPTGARQVPLPLGRAFEEVAFTVRVPQGHFLFIGPSERLSRRSLVGAALLADELDGQPTEWALFVTPTVVTAKPD